MSTIQIIDEHYSDMIRNVCQQRIAAWSSALPFTESWIIRIVQDNLNHGRFQRFSRNRAAAHPATLPEYVDAILFYACREYSRVSALEEKDREAWQQLRDLLAYRAFRTWRRFRSAPMSFTESFDYAHDVCLIIFRERYPFDVPFDAWVTLILNRLILAQYTRSTDALDRTGPVFSLDAPPGSDGDDPTALGERLMDKRSFIPFERIEDQAVLLEAINRLHSPIQRRVIQATFIEGLSGPQIAKQLGKSQQAIYNLRERALQQLRVILKDMNVPE